MICKQYSRNIFRASRTNVSILDAFSKKINKIKNVRSAFWGGLINRSLKSLKVNKKKTKKTST